MSFFEPMLKEKAKAKQASHTEQGYQKSDKAEHTAKELAKAAGVSHDTILMPKMRATVCKTEGKVMQTVKRG